MEKVSTDEVVETIRQSLAEFAEVEPDELSRDQSLESLDIDSLDLVELAQIIEERYGLMLEAEDFKGVETVGAAMDVIVGRYSA